MYGKNGSITNGFIAGFKNISLAREIAKAIYSNTILAEIRLDKLDGFEILLTIAKY